MILTWMFMLHHGIGIDTGFYTVSKYSSTTAALLVIYILLKDVWPLTIFHAGVCIVHACNDTFLNTPIQNRPNYAVTLYSWLQTFMLCHVIILNACVGLFACTIIARSNSVRSLQHLSQVPPRQRRITWYSWTSAKYWQLSDKLQASADSNGVWSAVTKSLNLNSKGLALGLAEGTILFKFTVPIHMPLMLFSIVSFFRHRHWVVAETSSQSHSQDQKAARVEERHTETLWNLVTSCNI